MILKSQNKYGIRNTLFYIDFHLNEDRKMDESRNQMEPIGVPNQ